MKYSIHLTLEGTNHVVERPDHYLGWPVYSTAFVCPFCLRLWCVITNEEKADPYHIQGASCRECPPGHWILNPVSGSILDNSTFSSGPDIDLFEALPEPLLKREYDLHIQHFERYQNANSNKPDDDSDPFLIDRALTALGGQRTA